jgi:hypothetical protein
MRVRPALALTAITLWTTVSATVFGDEYVYIVTQRGKPPAEEVFSLNKRGTDFNFEFNTGDYHRSGALAEDGTGKTIVYSIPEKDDRVSVELENGVMNVSGIAGGKRVAKTLQPDAPWIILMHFFPRIVRVNEREIFLSVFKVSDYSLVKIRVIKEAEEALTVMDRPVDTVRVRVSMTGLLSALGHSDYWFRKSDGVLVKSKEFNGITRELRVVREAAL